MSCEMGHGWRGLGGGEVYLPGLATEFPRCPRRLEQAQIRVDGIQHMVDQVCRHMF